MYEDIYCLWREKCRADQELYSELEEIEEDAAELEDRFYRDLKFGTGGMRGLLGAGPNRMNRFTVGRAAFGLAEYLLAREEKGGAVIAYDTRYKSRDFAFETAEILSSKGISAYVFAEPVPTPVLSFMVRHLRASAGVVITASHNPKEYNGYKVYNARGCQITERAAAEITREMERIGYFTAYEPDHSLIRVLGEEDSEPFFGEIYKLALSPECSGAIPSIVYTPLNGTGNKPVKKALAHIGAKKVAVVPEQEMPDSNFSTCPIPNPEEKSALAEALSLARRLGADLVLATDPDADRVAAAERTEGVYRLFNGNETGVLLENYILERRRAQHRLPASPLIVKTIVTTDMADAVAESYGASVKEVLTGFKYIGETIDEPGNEKNFVMGLEESCGYLAGTHVRDKDGVSAAMLIAEMAGYYRLQGRSLCDVLNGLYARYGYYATGLFSVRYPGKRGKQEMDSFIARLRRKPLNAVCGMDVTAFIDYGEGRGGLPKSDVLSFRGELFRVIVRPSGTEPKLKIYLQAKGRTEGDAERMLASLEKEMRAFAGAGR